MDRVGETRAAETSAVLLARFTARAERAAAVVHRCATVEAAANLIVSLAGGQPVSVSATLLERHPALGGLLAARVEVIRPRSPSDAARAAIGVGAGEALVAESGSVLVAEYGLEDRLVSMLSPVLVQVVPASAIIATFEGVATLLAERHAGGVPRYHALVTGPSRSADIERSLTVGVQGPAEVHVVILSGDTEESEG